LGHEHADAPHPLALLRACCERPRGRRATEQRDELATFQLVEVHPALFRIAHTAS
jgi:hypothetical protein